VIAEQKLPAPAVIVVDHGGPSAASGALRDEIAAAVRRELGTHVSQVAAASMEGEAHAHNQPLLADLLRAPGFNQGDIIVAPLFLSPGRHAGPSGDLAQIAAQVRLASPGLRCHFTGLVGTHPLAADALATALRATLSTLHAETLV
jgi:sirohydrochlorin ferrochelatase